MAFIPIPNAVKVVLHQVWNGQSVKNIIWFHKPVLAPYTQAERATLITDLTTWWNNHQKTSVSSTLALQAIEVINQDTSSSPSSMTVFNPPLQGTGGPAVPLNVALTASLRTSQRGRNFRGRIYVGGLQSGNLADLGTYTTAGAAGLATTVAKLIDPLVITNSVLAVASHFFNKQPRAQGVLNDVTAVIVETLLDSMRRRLIGRGA